MERLLPIVLVLCVLFTAPGAASAQRIAFVNTTYIMEQLPEYNTAQKELDRMSTQWQEEIDERYATIRRLRDAYNAEAILLTEEMKKTRLADIESKERDARDLQKKRFGPKGDLFKKRQELIQPIQDRVYTAIKEVAGTSYVAIFDLGGQNSNLLFASEKYDKSDSVLRKLGVRPGKDGTPGDKDEEFGEPTDEPGQVRDEKGAPPPDRMDGGKGQDIKPR
jgi:outer membrane protein